MFIAYLTTDETNQAVAVQLAAESGVTLHAVAPKNVVPLECFDAVLYDIDYLPDALRATILAELQAGPSLPPRAVHSFNLEEDQEAALRRNGVVVLRRLQREMFLHLSGVKDQTHAGVLGALEVAAEPSPNNLQSI
jgi:hypothetical protein